MSIEKKKIEVLIIIEAVIKIRLSLKAKITTGTVKMKK